MTSDGQGNAAGQRAGMYRRVVVGIDDSPDGLAALRSAVSMARTGHAQLVAVRSWELGPPRHRGRRRRHLGRHGTVLASNGVQQCMESDNLVRQAFQAATGGIPRDIDLTIRTPEGDPGVVLTRTADAGGGVLVVGTQPGHLARRLVHGSVSRYCRRHALCPLIVISAAARAALTR